MMLYTFCGSSVQSRQKSVDALVLLHSLPRIFSPYSLPPHLTATPSCLLPCSDILFRNATLYAVSQRTGDETLKNQCMGEYVEDSLVKRKSMPMYCLASTK